MRYIILPFFGLLYLWWSYLSIRNIYNYHKTANYDSRINMEDFAEHWMILHIMVLFVAFLASCIYFW